MISLNEILVITGLSISDEHSDLTYNPETRTLHLDPIKGSRLYQKIGEKYNEEELEHEIGHYLVATEEEKSLPNYGLGPDTNRIGGWIQKSNSDSPFIEGAVTLWQNSRGRGLPMKDSIANDARTIERFQRAIQFCSSKLNQME